MNEFEEGKLPSLVKEGSREAAGGSFNRINLWINTTPALRATPPHLSSSEEGSFCLRQQVCDFAVRGSTVFRLHHAVVAPSPAVAQEVFLDSVRRGVGVMEALWSEQNTQFSQEFFESRGAVCQSWKLDAVPVDVLHHCSFPGDDYFSEHSEIALLRPKELDQFTNILKRSRVDNHLQKV